MTHFSKQNPYEAFYHGLVVSKLWLCENLERILSTLEKNKPKVKILGGWHNLLAFMLLIRKPYAYDIIHSYDKDVDATNIANNICDTWHIEEPKVLNIVADVNILNFNDCDDETIFLNCSVDQFIDTSWYDTIPKGCLVCMQTTDIIDDSQSWEIIQKTKNLLEFKNKYPMQTVLFEGVKNISYSTFSYNRLMIIGLK